MKTGWETSNRLKINIVPWETFLYLETHTWPKDYYHEGTSTAFAYMYMLVKGVVVCVAGLYVLHVTL
jgi:hypothetical protein